MPKPGRSQGHRAPPKIDLGALREAVGRNPIRGDVSPIESDTAETLDERIYRLKLEGYNPKDIAYATQVPVSVVEDTIIRMAEASRSRLLAELSVGAIVEVDRLEAMHKALWPYAKAGEAAAIDRVMAISKDRRKLLGLDAPSGIGSAPETDLTVLTDEELRDYERIQRKLVESRGKKRLPKPSPPPTGAVIDAEVEVEPGGGAG